MPGSGRGGTVPPPPPRSCAWHKSSDGFNAAEDVIAEKTWTMDERSESSGFAPMVVTLDSDIEDAWEDEVESLAIAGEEIDKKEVKKVLINTKGEREKNKYVVGTYAFDRIEKFVKMIIEDAKKGICDIDK